jgi:hypothetical protein
MAVRRIPPRAWIVTARRDVLPAEQRIALAETVRYHHTLTVAEASALLGALALGHTTDYSDWRRDHLPRSSRQQRRHRAVHDFLVGSGRAGATRLQLLADVGTSEPIISSPLWTVRSLRLVDLSKMPATPDRRNEVCQSPTPPNRLKIRLGWSATLIVFDTRQSPHTRSWYPAAVASGPSEVTGTSPEIRVPAPMAE